jgi:hypothetical protein
MFLVLLQLEDYKCLLSMYFAMYYFFDKLADDTCIALDEYQLNPQTVRPARLAHHPLQREVVRQPKSECL